MCGSRCACSCFHTSATSTWFGAWCVCVFVQRTEPWQAFVCAVHWRKTMSGGGKYREFPHPIKSSPVFTLAAATNRTRDSFSSSVTHMANSWVINRPTTLHTSLRPCVPLMPSFWCYWPTQSVSKCNDFEWVGSCQLAKTFLYFHKSCIDLHHICRLRKKLVQEVERREAVEVEMLRERVSILEAHRNREQFISEELFATLSRAVARCMWMRTCV